VGGQHHAPAALPLGKTRYPLYRRLGGPQGRSGRVRKISPPTGIFFFFGSHLFLKNSLHKFFSFFFIPVIYPLHASQRTIPTMPDNPWEHIFIASASGIRSPDRPARSQSLYRLSYPAHGRHTVIGVNYTVVVVNYTATLNMVDRELLK
jgi:hypothetical protein